MPSCVLINCSRAHLFRPGETKERLTAAESSDLLVSQMARVENDVKFLRGDILTQKPPSKVELAPE